MIEGILDAIEENTGSLSLHYDLIENLKEIYDIERIVGRISTKSVNAKELISLKKSIEKIPAIKASLSNFKSSLYVSMKDEIDDLEDVHQILQNSITDNPGLSAKEGNIIKEGFSQEVDDLRNAKTKGKEWISALES